VTERRGRRRGSVAPPAVSEEGTERRGRRRPPVLVVGVGSELRSDDAAGRRVAEAVDGLGLDGVETRSVHQLTPELAPDLEGRRLVVLVDAAVDVEDVTVRSPSVSEAGAASHHLDPGALLALAARLGWAPDAATVVHVPVVDLGLGTALAPETRLAVRRAAEVVAGLVAGAGDQDAALPGPVGTPGT
jgi:hydrogenase maturation protease